MDGSHKVNLKQTLDQVASTLWILAFSNTMLQINSAYEIHNLLALHLYHQDRIKVWLDDFQHKTRQVMMNAHNNECVQMLSHRSARYNNTMVRYKMGTEFHCTVWVRGSMSNMVSTSWTSEVRSQLNHIVLGCGIRHERLSTFPWHDEVTG